MAGPSQVPSEEGNTEEALLGEEAELMRQRRKQRGDIEKTAMIGDENVVGFRIELLNSLRAHADQADGNKHFAPYSGDAMGCVAAPVKE